MTKPEQTTEKMATCAGRYARSAEVAGKMLGHLVEAGCHLPSVVLFNDGSGHFVVHCGSSETFADDVFKRFLGKVPYKSHSRERPPNIEYSIDYDTFDVYREACPECKRPM